MSRPRTLRDTVQTLLDRRLSIRQLVNLAILGGVGLGVYLVIGLAWAGNHIDHLAETQGLNKIFSVLGEIIAWPVLIIADVDLR